MQPLNRYEEYIRKYMDELISLRWIIPYNSKDKIEIAHCRSIKNALLMRQIPKNSKNSPFNIHTPRNKLYTRVYLVAWYAPISYIRYTFMYTRSFL
jgi:hypothetical protein